MEIVINILTVIAWIVGLIQYFTVNEFDDYLFNRNSDSIGERILRIGRNIFYTFGLYKVEGVVGAVLLGECVSAWKLGTVPYIAKSIGCATVFVLFIIVCMVKFYILISERDSGNFFAVVFVLVFVCSVAHGTIDRVNYKTTYANNIEQISESYELSEERSLVAFFGRPLDEIEQVTSEELSGSAEKFGITNEIRYCYLNEEGNIMYDVTPFDTTEIIPISNTEKARLVIESSHSEDYEVNHNTDEKKLLNELVITKYCFYLPEEFLISMLGDAYIAPPIIEAG